MIFFVLPSELKMSHFHSQYKRTNRPDTNQRCCVCNLTVIMISPVFKGSVLSELWLCGCCVKDSVQSGSWKFCSFNVAVSKTGNWIIKKPSSNFYSRCLQARIFAFILVDALKQVLGQLLKHLRPNYQVLSGWL